MVRWLTYRGFQPQKKLCLCLKAFKFLRAKYVCLILRNNYFIRSELCGTETETAFYLLILIVCRIISFNHSEVTREHIVQVSLSEVP